MATFLIIVMGFLLSYRRARLIKMPLFTVLFLTCLAPLGLGETKIVLFMIPLAGLVIYRHDPVEGIAGRTVSLKKIFALLALGLATVVFGYVYLTLYLGDSLSDIVESTLAYNFEDFGYGNFLLNRTTALIFWWSQNGLHDPFAWLFGHGLGSSFWSESTVTPGHIGAQYPMYGIGITAASTLLWDVGVIGLLLYVSIFATAWLAANRLFEKSNDVRVRADALAIQAAISLFMLHVLYRSTMLDFLPFQIVVAVFLGYLGHLVCAESNSSVKFRRRPAQNVEARRLQ
jgi:hypothetical protein